MEYAYLENKKHLKKTIATIEQYYKSLETYRTISSMPKDLREEYNLPDNHDMYKLISKWKKIMQSKFKKIIKSLYSNSSSHLWVKVKDEDKIQYQDLLSINSENPNVAVKGTPSYLKLETKELKELTQEEFIILYNYCIHNLTYISLIYQELIKELLLLIHRYSIKSLNQLLLFQDLKEKLMEKIKKKYKLEQLVPFYFDVFWESIPQKILPYIPDEELKNINWNEYMENYLNINDTAPKPEIIFKSLYDKYLCQNSKNEQKTINKEKYKNSNKTETTFYIIFTKCIEKQISFEHFNSIWYYILCEILPYTQEEELKNTKWDTFIEYYINSVIFKSPKPLTKARKK